MKELSDRQSDQNELSQNRKRPALESLDRVSDDYSRESKKAKKEDPHESGPSSAHKTGLESSQSIKRGSKIELSTDSSVRLHQITLPRKYILQIRSGKKTIEGRVNSTLFKNFKADERVRFFYTQNPQDDVTCKIIKVVHYPSFREMLKAEGFKRCLPEIDNHEDACREYDKIPNYTKNAAQFGVLAIHIQKIN